LAITSCNDHLVKASLQSPDVGTIKIKRLHDFWPVKQIANDTINAKLRN